MIRNVRDKNGLEFNTNKVYYDTINNVRDIHIAKIENSWYAIPDELDEEFLEDVCDFLVVQD